MNFENGTLLDNQGLQDACAMKPSDKTLLQKLALALLVKLVLLAGLWWGFVREQRVSVDGDAAAAQLLGTANVKTLKE